MRNVLAAEVEALLTRLRRKHDVLPFLQQLLPSTRVRLARLSVEMLEQLRISPDFASVRPGEPVWIALAAPPVAAAELVLYRAEAGGSHYMAALAAG